MGEPEQEEVAGGVSGGLTTPEPSQRQRREVALRPVVYAVGGRERGHPEVAERDDGVVPTQPTGGATVVRDRHDRGPRDIETRECRERTRAPVAASDDHDRGSRGLRVHSAPRSRWTSRTPTSVRSDRCWATCSAIATERCLPPVQPIATVR